MADPGLTDRALGEPPVRVSSRLSRAERTRRRAPRALTLIGVVGSLAVTPWLSRELVVAVVAALGLGVIGVLAEERVLPPWSRAGGPYLAATAVVIAGLYPVASGSRTSDALLAALAVAVTAGSFCRLDAQGGGAAWSGAVLLAATALVASNAGHGSDAVLASVAAAPCVCALVLGGLRRLTPRLGLGGSLFTGMLIAAIALDAASGLTFPRSVLIPAMLVALPVLDAACAAATRLRRGRLRLADTGLLGRLRARQIPLSVAVLLIVATEALLGGVAVLYSASAVSTAAALAVTSAVVGLVLFAVTVVPVPASSGRLSPRARWMALVLGLAVAAVAGFAAVDVVRAGRQATSAENAAEHALSAARGGDSRQANRDFAAARHGFDQARAALNGPVPSVGLGIPVLGQNLDATRKLLQLGSDLSRDGQQLTSSADPQQIAVSGGSIRIDRLRQIEPMLSRSAADLSRAEHQLRIVDRQALLGPVRHVVRRIQARLVQAVSDARDATEAVRILPALLGGDGDRHYFLSVQNNGEARGTGGFMGNWGELTFSNGHVDLARFGRVQELNDAAGSRVFFQTPAAFLQRYHRFQPTWGDLNVTPDFATYASLVANLYPASGGRAVDGVIGVDPVGLAAILRLTGPIAVPNWPVPITADNVVRVTLLDAYNAIPDRTIRANFLGDVARTAFDAFKTRGLGRASQVVNTLTAAIDGRHIMVWFNRPSEQRFAENSGIGGALPAKTTDQVTVVTNNHSANKIDQFVHRFLLYSARVGPVAGTDRFSIQSQLFVLLRNQAPSGGLAPEVLGPGFPGLAAGESSSDLSVLSPLGLDKATIDGASLTLERFTELGRNAYSTEITNFSGQDRTLMLSMSGTVPQAHGGWYELNLTRQPLLVPDGVDVLLQAAPGYRFVAAQGLRIMSNGHAAKADLSVIQTATLRVRLAPDRTNRR